MATATVTYHMMCDTTGANSGAGTAYPSGTPVFAPDFQWNSYYAIFTFLCSVLQIVVCSFVLFLLAIALSVLSIYGFWLLRCYFQTLLPCHGILLNIVVAM